MNHWLKMNLKQANKIKGKIMWTADMTVLKMNIRVRMSRQGVPEFLICEHMVGNSFSTHLLWDISLGASQRELEKLMKAWSDQQCRHNWLKRNCELKLKKKKRKKV